MAFDFYNNGDVEIDSLQLRIPIEECENTWRVGEPFEMRSKVTGEISPKEFKTKAVQFDIGPGIKIRVGIVSETYGVEGYNGNTANVLTITLNAKILMSLKYFNGVRKDNIKIIYDTLMSIPDFPKFSYDSFIKARCVDIDLCKNFPCKLSRFQETLKYLSKHVAPSEKKDELLLPYRAKPVKIGDLKTNWAIFFWDYPLPFV
jgi:hypothetical protein